MVWWCSVSFVVKHIVSYPNISLSSPSVHSQLLPHYLLFNLFILLPPSCILVCLYLEASGTELHLLACMNSRKLDLFSLNFRCRVNRKQEKTHSEEKPTPHYVSCIVLYYNIVRETLYCVLIKLPEAQNNADHMF